MIVCEHIMHASPLTSCGVLRSDSDGRTPLIWAVDRGNLSAVEILVAKGAEINAKVVYHPFVHLFVYLLIFMEFFFSNSSPLHYSL